MQTLLSLPENLVASFHSITGYNPHQWFALSDPKGLKIGSGGGTAHLLREHKLATAKSRSFADYLAAEKRIIIHAGGQSRRLPCYAPSGKILAPLPVFKWSRGQRIDQCLLDLQMPLLEKIIEISGPSQHVLIAAGDVLVTTNELPFELPDADVVCIGIWADPHLASNHGVFFTPRTDPHRLDFMLQKPSHKTIEELSMSHLFLMDVGIWMLSDRAVSLLMRKCFGSEAPDGGTPSFYDLYSTFGTCLGDHPSVSDNEISKLTSAIVPLHNGAFYHYGTSPELIASTERIQNKVQDQRNIWHIHIKPHPSIFVQNSLADIQWSSLQHHIWIENSHIPSTWNLTNNHIITGIPGNDWEINLDTGICVDIVPVDEEGYCIRIYGITDTFRGMIGDPSTLWMGKSVVQWFKRAGMTMNESGIDEEKDIQSTGLFPVTAHIKSAQQLVRWMLKPTDDMEMKKLWLQSARLSADEICSRANLLRLFRQRVQFRQQNLGKLAMNYKRSIFYQSDLKFIANEFSKTNIPLHGTLAETEPALIRCRDHMFRSEVLKLKGFEKEAVEEERIAFSSLQTSMTSAAPNNLIPRINIFYDQIVWGRSPARLDLAGGWSDTPPYCIQNGGSVLNMAVELNGQPPIQVFIRLCQEYKITMRSIDNGVSEEVSTFDDIRNFQQVGSAFSIPKAALYLAGFHPDFCGVSYHSLAEQLKEFGGGFEISLLAAIPKGSGLGTSSILAATILGTLSDFCSLNWDRSIICHQTLILEQLLTTGGGWQDQFGGVLPGVKLLQSQPGVQDHIDVRWMPDNLFVHPEFKDNWLLYYTGITRIAKNILTEIVRGMFLNERHCLRIANEIKQHAYTLSDAIQRSDYTLTGKMVSHSWKLNNALDSGTNTPEIQKIIDTINDYCIGFKLLGAGGGGYMIIAAKDAGAALKLQAALTQNPPNNKARFVKMDLSIRGFQISRS
jgi:galactokinase/mevalonate kinase-like predicted kinase